MLILIEQFYTIFNQIIQMHHGNEKCDVKCLEICEKYCSELKNVLNFHLTKYNWICFFFWFLVKCDLDVFWKGFVRFSQWLLLWGKHRDRPGRAVGVHLAASAAVAWTRRTDRFWLATLGRVRWLWSGQTHTLRLERKRTQISYNKQHCILH